MYFVETTYRVGEKTHIHTTHDGRKIYCPKSHKRADYSKVYLTIIALVEAGLILFLINKNW